jgi:hypothetical protein
MAIIKRKLKRQASIVFFPTALKNFFICLIADCMLDSQESISWQYMRHNLSQQQLETKPMKTKSK